MGQLLVEHLLPGTHVNQRGRGEDAVKVEQNGMELLVEWGRVHGLHAIGR